MYQLLSGLETQASSRRLVVFFLAVHLTVSTYQNGGDIIPVVPGVCLKAVFPVLNLHTSEPLCFLLPQNMEQNSDLNVDVGTNVRDSGHCVHVFFRAHE